MRALRATDERPRVLVSASAVGYYGAHGEEPLDEEAPAGQRLPRAGVRRLGGARRARPQQLGVRVVQVRTGVVLDPRGGALAKMLPPFRLGVGGPVAGGRQYISWIHTRRPGGDDAGGARRRALAGPVNATAPEPVTNRELLARRSGARCTAPRCCRCRAAALRLLLRRDGADRDQPARACCRPRRWCSATSSATPSSSEALRAALG